MKKLHLDSEYRRRWQEYHMADGRVINSCHHNWRQIEWEKVVKVVTVMNGDRYEVSCSDPRFKFFLAFRWGGQEAVYKNGVYTGHKPIHIWTHGWTDGHDCFLQDIDFFSGKRVAEYKTPLNLLKKHIHPRVRGVIK